MGKINQYISNLKLRDKFFMAYLFLLVIPLIIVGTFLYTKTINESKDEIIKKIDQTINQASVNVVNIRRQVEDFGDMCFKDMDLQAILKRENAQPYMQVDEFKSIINLSKRIQDNPNIYRVRIYVPNYKTYARSSGNIFCLDDLNDDIYFNKIIEDGYISGWTASYNYVDTNGLGNKIVSYITILKDLDNVRKVIGCLYIDVLEIELSTVLNGINIGNDMALLINADGEIIAKSCVNLHSSIQLLNAIKNNLKDETRDTTIYNELRWNEKKYMVLDRNIPGTPWSIVYIADKQEILRNARLATRFTVIIIFSVIIMVSFITIAVSNRITKGIEDFIKQMNEITILKDWKWNDEIDTDSYTDDEIGQLKLNFQMMLGRIRQLIDENYEVQLQKREAELRALQAQINPHFLYNVLDSINWMAIANDVMDISEMVTELGRFYRLGLSGGREIITIREEIEHVKTYLNIQRIRFGNLINTHIDVPDRILNYCIVKLSLQPLVENAIVHGVLSKPSQQGFIHIIGQEKDEDILVSIVDDGIGANFKKANYVLSDPNSIFTQGFGIKNVDERIKLYFGNEYGISIKRKDDLYTVVDICIPKQDYNDMYM